MKKNKSNRIDVTIPEGFYYKEGTIDNGYVIEDSDENQYVLIPSGYNTEGIFVKAFWISRFEISKGNENVPRSVSGKMPWTNINFYKACEVADSIDGGLISGEEYNRICMWLVQTNAAKFESVYIDGRSNGNYFNKKQLTVTGSNPKWQHNHIFDFFGNGYIWTMERSELYHRNRIIRGGQSLNPNTRHCYPASNRAWKEPEKSSSFITFRIKLPYDF